VTNRIILQVKLSCCAVRLLSVTTTPACRTLRWRLSPVRWR